MSLEELIKEFKGAKNPRKHKVSHSLGVYDAYKWVRKNKWLDIGLAITEHQFYTIIRLCNQLLANDLLQGRKVTLPCKMGILELFKLYRRLEYKDGKLITTLPIDWDSTLKLWAEWGKSDKLIRFTNPEIFQVRYLKSKADFTNKGFYGFQLNRGIKKALKNKILNKQIDAMMYYE